MRFLLFAFFILLSPFSFASAHVVGQPPFFKVNGTYANFYTVPGTSIAGASLPQDLAPDSYLINTPINFTFDKANMPLPTQIIDSSKFDWDFGDGTKGEGLAATHTYTKTGSYALKVDITYSSGGSELIESVFFNILPSRDYKVPKAIITANGKTAQDVNHPLKISFSQPVTLDGSKSEAGSAKIVTSSWDLGDGQGADGATATHTYSGNLGSIVPYLHLVNADGFITDAPVFIENSDLVGANETAASPAPTPVSTKSSSTTNWYTLGGVILLIVLGFAAVSRRR